MTLFGGIEAGGTKFICAIGTGPDDIRAEARIDTTTPAETLQNVVAFFQSQAQQTPLVALGIASFGPVDPDPASVSYGYITTTPKPGWANTNLAGYLGQRLSLPVGFDTDVNGAALGEYRWGAAQGLNTFIYLTIGTGLGGGGLIGGKLMHGLIHPEMGHISVPRHPDDTYAGFCPYHGDCFEGVAAGPALEGRWGQPAETLPLDHPAWEMEAYYLAAGLVNLICTLSPQRIIMGGGVMAQHHLFPLVRSKTKALLNGYVQSPAIIDEIDSYIVPPALGGQAGILGAFALAERIAG